MSKLTQSKWDTLLIRAWIKDKKLAWVLRNFFDDERMELTKMIELLSDLNIKRSKTMDRVPCWQPVRAFFADNCRNLSDKFFDGEDPITYLFSLDDYKWCATFNKKDAAKKHTSRYRSKMLNGRNVRVGSCGGSIKYDTDWGKVK